MRVSANYAALDDNSLRFKPEHGPAAFTCSVCGENHALNTEGKGCATGYALGPDSNAFICYPCAGEGDKKRMRETGEIVLYLSCDNGVDKVSNWPGTLSIKPRYVKRGRHNFARVRYDVWFQFEGEEWHGVQYGDFTQILRCKRIKRRA